MGFITSGPRRVGMLVLWPSRTPSTRRVVMSSRAGDTNGRSGGVVAMRVRMMTTRRVERVIVRRDRAVWGTVRANARRRSPRDARGMGRRSRRETEETNAVMTRVLVHDRRWYPCARARAFRVDSPRTRAVDIAP